MSSHDDLHKKAQIIQSRFKDFVDQPNHSQARSAFNEINGLISDIRGQKPGSHIDSRLKSVIRYLENLEEEVMDFRHSNLISGMCEDMRREAARL